MGRILPFSAWRARHLLLGWSMYWVALLAGLLAPAIPALWRISRPDAHGSASASFGDGAFKVMISEGTTVAWTGEISFLTLVLLFGVPPLILWAFWLRAHRRKPA